MKGREWYNKLVMKLKDIAQLIKKYRSALMGIAMIWILLFHTSWNMIEPFYTVIHKGYGGVDIFLFLSGFGIYYSLEKKRPLLSFYWRRIRKIYPSYLVVLFLVFCQQYSGLRTEGFTRQELFFSFFANVFLFAFLLWTPLVFNWYIFCIMYFYLLSPLFHFLIRKRMGPVLLLGSLFISIPFFGNTSYLMVSARLFIFLLGMYVSYLSEERPDLRIDIRIIYGLMIIGIIVLLYLTTVLPIEIQDRYALYFYPFMIITPGLVLFLCRLLEKINRGSYPVLELLGKASLEIYLVNVSFKNGIFIKIAHYIGWNEWVWPIGIVIMVLMGLGLYFLIKRVMALLNDLIGKKLHRQ